MTYENLINWFEDNEDIENMDASDLKDLVKKIKNYNDMTDSKQATLKKLLRDAFGWKKYHYQYRRISLSKIKHFKSSYKTAKNYAYALKRVYE